MNSKPPPPPDSTILPPPDTEAVTSPQTPAAKKRGFAAMDPNKVSEIAAKGGKAAHALGTAHKWTPDQARIAGRKGGQVTHAKKRAAGQGDPT